MCVRVRVCMCVLTLISSYQWGLFAHRSPPSSPLRPRESVGVSVPAGEIALSSHTPKPGLHPLLYLLPLLNLPSLPSHRVIPCSPLSLPVDVHRHKHVHFHRHAPRRLYVQTDANRLLVLLVTVGVSFEMNLYTSAWELASIGLNSFNSHDICLRAYYSRHRLWPGWLPERH